MTDTQEAELRAAIEYCNARDKSTEFMLAYCADVAGVSEEDVIEFLEENPEITIGGRNAEYKKQG